MTIESICYSSSPNGVDQIVQNKNIIIQKIDEQFKKAVDEVNQIAKEERKRGVQAIGYSALRKNSTLKDIDIIHYTIAIINDVNIEYNSINTYTSLEPITLYIGKIDPSLDEHQYLVEVAKKGYETDFTKVYIYWKYSLSSFVNFYNENYLALCLVKSSVSGKFSEALQSANTYAKSKGWRDIRLMGQLKKEEEITNEVFQKMTFQPLQSYTLYKQDRENEGVYHSIGSFVPFERGHQEFARIINDEPYSPCDFVYNQMVAKMKKAIDKRVEKEASCVLI